MTAQSFARQVDELLAMVGETLDEDLLEATRSLRDVAAEHDEVDGRFQAAAAKLKQLLEGRLPGR